MHLMGLTTPDKCTRVRTLELLRDRRGDVGAGAGSQRVELEQRVIAGDRAIGAAKFDSDQYGAFGFPSSRAPPKTQCDTSFISYPLFMLAKIDAAMSRGSFGGRQRPR